MTFVAFGLFAVHGPVGAPRLERALAGSVRADLESRGHPWASVSADGQRIKLSGAAPDAAALEEAVNLASRTIGAGGVLFGAVTAVDASEVTLAATVQSPGSSSDYRFKARFDDGLLNLAGAVPSPQALAAMTEAFPETVIVRKDDNFTIAPRANDTAWIAAASALMHALAILDRGDLEVVGDTFALTGEAARGEDADAAESLTAGAEGPFQIKVAIVRRSAEDLARSCQSAINRVMTGRTLIFRSNSVELAGSDRNLLDELMSEIRSCRGQTIGIEGHTDLNGTLAANSRLSERRAQSVRDYLGAPPPRQNSRSGLSAKRGRSPPTEHPTGAEEIAASTSSSMAARRNWISGFKWFGLSPRCGCFF